MAAIPALITGAVELVKRFWPDKSESEQRAIAERMAIASQEHELNKGQLEINKIEAANDNLFVSGWRPSIGWVCSCAYLYNYILQPLLIFIFAAANHPVSGIPQVNLNEMMPVLGGLLGLGYFRTHEKVKGVSR